MAPTAFQGTTPPQQPEGIVTPEAVVLEFATAGVGSRTAAYIVDAIIQSTVGYALLIAGLALSAIVTELPVWLLATLVILVYGFLILGYPIVFETAWRGKTPGKAALGLRVVTTEGAPIRFRHAAIRAMVGLFELIAMSGLVAFCVVFFSKRHQRLGDMAAGTLVLRERQAARAPIATTFFPPPGTEEYASTLDVSSLTSDEYLTIRSFLTRANALNPKSRQGLADQLARQFVGRTQTIPPEWMPSEVFLICLAAAYQRRFASALVK